ncbi:RNA polymerase sigma-I factor [Cohnella suwonensis]|uniref:RNA polymerase sigma factor SigI n=1 Tax=Cohnella suwonensis TaxID=696072 RepID=A0ABW0LXP2_9BACL
MLLVLLKKWLSSPERPAVSPRTGEGPESQVERIRQGEERLRDELIRSYHPYILKTTSRFCRRYVDPAHDDAYSVALTAFDEAINRFSSDAGRSFLGFAETVIQRRLIDHARQERKHAAVVPYSSFDADPSDGESPGNRLEIAQAMEAYERKRTADDRKAEIAALSEELAGYGITFGDLADHSPRHRDSRVALLKVGRRMGEDERLCLMLRQKKQLPIKELCEGGDITRKTAERHRKYLIAVGLIAYGTYPYLREYIGLDHDGEEATS